MVDPPKIPNKRRGTQNSGAPLGIERETTGSSPVPPNYLENPDELQETPPEIAACAVGLRFKAFGLNPSVKWLPPKSWAGSSCHAQVGGASAERPRKGVCIDQTTSCNRSVPPKMVVGFLLGKSLTPRFRRFRLPSLRRRRRPLPAGRASRRTARSGPRARRRPGSRAGRRSRRRRARRARLPRLRFLKAPNS